MTESHFCLKAIPIPFISELAVSLGSPFGKWPLLSILRFARSYQEWVIRHGKWAPTHPWRVTHITHLVSGISLMPSFSGFFFFFSFFNIHSRSVRNVTLFSLLWQSTGLRCSFLNPSSFPFLWYFSMDGQSYIHREYFPCPFVVGQGIHSVLWHLGHSPCRWWSQARA